MKTALLLAFAITLLSAPLTAADRAPAILAPQAAQIAQADLESRGLQNQFFVAQVIYKKDSLMNGQAYWEVMWNDDFPAQTKGRKEFGLRITMDGNYKRAVK